MQSRFMARVACVAYIACFACSAKPALAAKDDGLEGGFLSWGAGARALALGKAFTAVADDASAAYWNPAGLTQLDRGEATALHAIMWEGATYDFVSVAFPSLTDGSFGMTVTMLGVGGVERRDAENNLLSGSFGSTKIAAGLSYGREINSWLAVGVTAKYLARWLDTVQTGFITGDVSVLSRLTKELSLGATVKQLGAVKFGDTDDTLPLQWRAGAAYKLLDGLLLVSAEMEQSGRWHVGTELVPTQLLQLRLGADTLESSAGVGLAFPDLKIDYNAGIHQELGLSHRFALTVQWGDGVGTVRIQRAQQRYQDALKAMAEGRAPEALNAANDVLTLDPRHGAAQLLRSRLESK